MYLLLLYRRSRAMASILFSIAYLLFVLLPPALACGGLVHGELAQRGRFLFSLQHDPKAHPAKDEYAARVAHWLQHYDASILAGSFIPDWGYQCSGASDLSEAMHWPPFLKAAVEHIRETYPHPETNEKAQALIAFIFAVSGHQVQDAAWHSIGLLMGFIDEVANVDCRGSYGAAHDILDWGGDAIFGKRFSKHKGAVDWAFGDWYVPVDDVAAIYKRMGKSMSTWQMKYCIIRLRGALLAAAKGASLFFKRYAQRSPFMLDYFDEYYLGGIDDMTSTTVECWTSLVDWFRDGNIGDPWNLCPLTTAITRRTESTPCLPDLFRKDLQSEQEEVSKYIHAEDKDGVFRVWYDGPRTFDSEITTTQPDFTNHSPTRNFSSHSAYARFGHSMAIGQFGLDHPLQIAVSSPFETHESHPALIGNVQILSISQDNITPTTILNPTYAPPGIPGMRFGLSLASFRVKGKSISALAVGAPGWNPAGRVFIYTGSATNNLDITPQLTIMPWHTVWFRSQYGKRAFGTKLFVADVDGDGRDDLLISSPWVDFTGGPLLPDPPDTDCPPFGRKWDSQHGGIAVFTGKQLDMMIGGTNVLDEDAAYYISPPCGDGWERFGTSLAFAKKSRVLLVGEPGSQRNATMPGRGRIYGIKVASDRPSTEFTIDGPEIQELPSEFGGGGLASGVSIDGTEWFAVGAHNMDYQDLRQAGVVEIYKLTKTFNKTGKSFVYGAKKMITLQAEEPQAYAKFGSVAESDGQDMLWISSGWANDEDGLVWSYNVTDGLSNLLVREIESKESVQQIFQSPQYDVAKVFAHGKEPRARFGDSLLVADFNGDGIKDLAIGSPSFYGSDAAPLAGRIDIFFLNKTG